MSVFAPMLGHIWRVVESYGLDPGELIDSAYYRPGAVTTVTDRVSFAEYDAIQTRAAALVKDPAIGLKSARYFSLHTWAPWVMPGWPVPPCARHCFEVNASTRCITNRWNCAWKN